MIELKIAELALNNNHSPPMSHHNL